MIRVALKGLLGRKLRAILTAFAIVLGVAMISGSFVLTDTLGTSLDGVYQESYKGTDAVISSKHKAQQADGTTEKAPLLGRRADRRRAAVRRRAPRRARSRITSASSTRRQADRQAGRRDRRRRQQSATTRRSVPSSSSAGTWPRHGDEIAIDRATATKQHFAVGQTIGAFGDGPVSATRSAG